MAERIFERTSVSDNKDKPVLNNLDSATDYDDSGKIQGGLIVSGLILGKDERINPDLSEEHDRKIAKYAKELDIEIEPD